MLPLLSLCCYAQEFSEDFEAAWTPGTGANTGPPGGWGIYEGGTGAEVNWVQSTAGNGTQPVYEGQHAAYLDKQNVPTGMAEDWLITPQFIAPENSQIRFYSRLTTPFADANTYEVRISNNPLQSALDQYDVLQSWTEIQINPVYDEYTEKVVDIPEEFFGQQVYVALVMTHDNGDRWLVDNFRVIEKCMPPTDLVIPSESITLNSAEISWTPVSDAAQWEIEAVPFGQPFTENGEIYNSPPPALLDGLEDSTQYQVRIRALCGEGLESDWSNVTTFFTDYGIPDNDECTDAVPLAVSDTPACSGDTFGYVAAATASGETNTCTGTADDDVWYEFTATETVHIITLSNVSGGDEDLVHVVYEGSCDALELRYCSDNDSSNAINLTIGDTYWVRVYSKAATPQEITYNICVTTPPPPPANDECSDAAEVTVNTSETCIVTTPGTLYSATASGQGNTCDGNDDDDVWFEFVATAPAHLISLIDITGGTPDLYHVVYHGGECGSLTQLYCSNPNNSLAQGLTIGETYKIRVYSFTGTPNQTTSFKVCIGTPPPPPANDECAAAEPLTVNPTLECTSVTPGTIYAATASTEANGCSGNSDDDVWYTFTATANSHTISLINVGGSTSNLFHVLYSGSYNNLTPIYCSDPNTSTAVGLTPGQTYMVRVYTFTGTSGQDTTFDICIGTPPVPPVNDECLTAVNVPVNPTDACTEKIAATVLAATASPQTNACEGIADDDIWFSFTATNATHLISLGNIGGSAPDLFHAVYSGNCDALSLLYCSNPNSSNATGLTTGQTYFVRVYTATATPGQTTSFEICVSTPPPAPENDECASAIAIPVNTNAGCITTVEGTIYSATASVEMNGCAGLADDDVWFTFVATSTNHNISIVNPSNPTTLAHALYSGECGTLSLLYCNSTGSSNAAYLTPGETYTLRIYSVTDDAGQTTDFEVCVTTPEPPIYTDADSYTVPQLVSDILVDTDCAQISNLSWKTGNTDGVDSVNGLAYFEANGSGFPIEEGIILSTGNAFLSRGPNTTELSGGAEEWTGDDDLFNYIQGLGIDADLESYNNATVLEFDFVPLTDHISFPFVFASEEYGTYQCTFSDAFAFFLTNTETGETTNLAVLPGTEIPISVVTIRDDANDDCDAANPEYYAQNNEGANAMAADINFNGQTVKLVAESDVEVNTVYHIKLVIADRNDELLDSAVFIGVFDIGRIDLGDDLLVETLNALCDGEIHTLDSGIDPELYAIKWFRNNLEIAGETQPTLTVTQPGTYTIEALYLASTCTSSESVIIEYYEPVSETTGNPEDLVLCDTNGTALFDLGLNTVVILEGLNADDYRVSYHLTAEDAEDDINPLNTEYENTAPEQTIYVRIYNELIDCYAVKSFKIIANDLAPDFVIEGGCRGNEYVIEIISVNDSFDPETATYSWTGPDGFNAADRAVVADVPGEYRVEVTTAEGCKMENSIIVGENQCLIPRGISPNGDGKNDSFDLSGMNVSYLAIYNRYGQEVYAKKDYTNEWHGQTEGGTLPTGTYYYMIELSSGESKTGWVYINLED